MDDLQKRAFRLAIASCEAGMERLKAEIERAEAEIASLAESMERKRRILEARHVALEERAGELEELAKERHDLVRGLAHHEWTAGGMDGMLRTARPFSDGLETEGDRP